ncbi:MAG: DNA (cytosine-5-)-methyltransferase [Nostocales cyanobacterium 94392]|nr:DNA (cytosine-5-)-methyltransferase [Nostocales cyanobacterium 94392]
MKVLSLFDGMSCGQIALNKAGIKYEAYYASEIDKYAIQVTQYNYPKTIQMGDIVKWGTWNIPWNEIDLIIAGSPCQGFSFAGKQLNFDDPRSRLFFVFVDILNHVKKANPNVKFLLENVKMKKEYENVITECLGINPVIINSSLVSAQNRVRLYWTNIGDIQQPIDKKIYLKDIIENGVVDRDKSFCVDANYWKGGNLTSYFEKHRRQLVFNDKEENCVSIFADKSQCILSTIYKENAKSMIQRKKRGLVVLHTSERGRPLTPDGTIRDDVSGIVVRGYEVRPDGKTCALTTVLKDNYITENYIIRKLTPIECERLQNVPDDFTSAVSSTQRYKMLGNGWTVDVIKHIFEQGLIESTIG